MGNVNSKIGKNANSYGPKSIMKTQKQRNVH